MLAEEDWLEHFEAHAAEVRWYILGLVVRALRMGSFVQARRNNAHSWPEKQEGDVPGLSVAAQLTSKLRIAFAHRPCMFCQTYVATPDTET